MVGSGYLPLHQQKKTFLVKLPLSKAAWITCLLPFTAFVFCIIWSLMYNFEDSTFTHCKVQNFLPSISAAIGNYKTQRFVWGTAIAIHAMPRFLFAGFHRRYYSDVLNAKAQTLALVACALNVVENLALIGLTFITSAYNYAIHEKCFMTFMITSEVYMALTCYLLSRERRIPADNIESRSLRYKYQLLAINMTSFAAAGYFFIRHNRHCEPYVYSAFAFFEYIVVLTNMAFHTTCSLDFHGRLLFIDQHVSVAMAGPPLKPPPPPPPLSLSTPVQDDADDSVYGFGAEWLLAVDYKAANHHWRFNQANNYVISVLES